MSGVSSACAQGFWIGKVSGVVHCFTWVGQSHTKSGLADLRGFVPRFCLCVLNPLLARQRGQRCKKMIMFSPESLHLDSRVRAQHYQV